MRHLQQVVCQRVALDSPCFEPSASNSQEAARSDCRFRSPYLDATEQTMSDRSDSDFIQRPSSTLTSSTDFPGNASDFRTMMRLPHRLAMVMAVA